MFDKVVYPDATIRDGRGEKQKASWTPRGSTKSVETSFGRLGLECAVPDSV